MYTDAGLVLLGLLILVGLVAHQGPLVALGSLLLVLGGVARLWSWGALKRLQYQRHLSELRAFVDERVELTISITNRKPLPLPFVKIEEEFPDDEGIALIGERLLPSSMPRRAYLSHSTALRWYERVGWRYQIECRRRGYYRLGPAHLYSGDPFGFFGRQRDEEEFEYLMVYPRVVPLEELGLPSGHPLGEVRGGERIFEDPGHVLGLRDYRPGDSLRRIDWKATARRGALQSKIYEPTTSRNVIVALNIDTFPRPIQGYDRQLLERAITVAASVAQHAADQRYTISLLSNGSLPNIERYVSVPLSRDPKQLARILEALAMVIPMGTNSLEEVLIDKVTTFPWGATVVLVSALLPLSLVLAVGQLRALGHKPVLITVSERRAELPWADVPIYGVGAYLSQWGL